MVGSSISVCLYAGVARGVASPQPGLVAGHKPLLDFAAGAGSGPAHNRAPARLSKRTGRATARAIRPLQHPTPRATDAGIVQRQGVSGAPAAGACGRRPRSVRERTDTPPSYIPPATTPPGVAAWLVASRAPQGCSSECEPNPGRCDREVRSQYGADHRRRGGAWCVPSAL